MSPSAQQSSSLPFGQHIPLASISGPTYLTAQALVQQVAYTLSDKLFTYSPDSFGLDAAAKDWHAQGEKNALGYRTGVSSMETRTGAGSIALGYMFSKDFDLKKRHVPQSIIASSGSLAPLRPALDQLSLLYNVANPTVAHIAAVDYAPSSSTGLVTDYVSAFRLAEDLGLGLVSSASAHEMQHMSLLATLMASIVPSLHVYDGITVGRETTRVIDVLDRAGLQKTYDAILADSSVTDKKHSDNEGRVSRLLKAFNGELGTDYKLFEYHGHAQPESVLVVFGTVEASLAAQTARALADRDVKIGVVNVRVYRPFVEEEFLAVLAPSVQNIAVLGQVTDQSAVADETEHSSLYSDVLASLTFAALDKTPAVFDIKYAREQVWTPAAVAGLLQQIGQKIAHAPSPEERFELPSANMQQYTFWDLDASPAAAAPLMLGQLLSADSKLNVTVRSGRDNLAQGGSIRTDIRTSAKSIEAAYSVTSADVAVVNDAGLLKSFDVVKSVKDGAVVLLKLANVKDDELEKHVAAEVRRALAAKKVQLHVLDPAASAKVGEEPELESYLVQLAFLKLARGDLYETGVKKLAGGNDALEALSKELDAAVRRVEIPESWLTAEQQEAAEPLPVPEDLNVNSFLGFDKDEPETPYLLRDWQAAAKGLAFKEAYGTKTAVRPDLGVKTAVVTVKERRRLTPRDYDRNIFHIEFDLGDTGLTYAIGEALGIHAENDRAEVEQFIEWYGLNPEEVVEVPSRDDADVLENRTVYQSLLQNIDIFGRPPKRFYEALSDFADKDAEKTQLLMLGTGGNQEAQVEFKRRAEVDTVTYADVLLEFPSAHPSFHDIVRLVAPMKRREYSIASSQRVTPNSVTLCIVTVNWVDPKGRDRFGQATRYLNGLEVGTPVTVSVKPSVMKLPHKSTAPIIMAGLGTGLAPFRAFVQERAWQKEHGMDIGAVMLYMGSRHQKEEYLYGEEWEAYMDAGIITHMGCAFSRDQPEKIYIQDRMRQSLADIRKAYLQEEGAFYLCGPTWPVPDVTNVLEEAIEVEAKETGKKLDPRKEIDRLKDEERYVLEVY